jgi:hypothetical protein
MALAVPQAARKNLGFSPDGLPALTKRILKSLPVAKRWIQSGAFVLVVSCEAEL